MTYSLWGIKNRVGIKNQRWSSKNDNVFLSVSDPWWSSNTVSVTEMEPPNVGIGWKLTSVGSETVLIETSEFWIPTEFTM